jgi:hypothetical protein
MNKRGYLYLLGFVAVLLAATLACGPTTAPTATPQVIVVTATTGSSGPAAVPTTAPAATAASSSGLVTFTDQNKYFAIDVPGDWTHDAGTATNAYSDTFTTPDKHAFVESVVYDDGTPWPGSSNGRVALAMLNTYYSYTKQEGDIRVSSDSIEKDGSEKLVWTSKGGGYSGTSWFEVRNRTAFLMFTIECDKAYTDQYQTMLDDVVTSYRHVQ